MAGPRCPGFSGLRLEIWSTHLCLGSHGRLPLCIPSHSNPHVDPQSCPANKLPVRPYMPALVPQRASIITAVPLLGSFAVDRATANLEPTTVSQTHPLATMDGVKDIAVRPRRARNPGVSRTIAEESRPLKQSMVLLLFQISSRKLPGQSAILSSWGPYVGTYRGEGLVPSVLQPDNLIRPLPHISLNVHVYSLQSSPFCYDSSRHAPPHTAGKLQHLVELGTRPSTASLCLIAVSHPHCWLMIRRLGCTETPHRHWASQHPMMLSSLDPCAAPRIRRRSMYRNERAPNPVEACSYH